MDEYEEETSQEVPIVRRFDWRIVAGIGVTFVSNVFYDAAVSLAEMAQVIAADCNYRLEMAQAHEFAADILHDIESLKE